MSNCFKNILDNCSILFSIVVFPEFGGIGSTLKRKYKRISSARRKAAALSLENAFVRIRIEERFKDYAIECSSPFEEYRQGKRIHAHKDYLTEVGKIAYGYI